MKKSGILLISLFTAALLLGCNEKESCEESSPVSESSSVTTTTEAVSYTESITTVLTETKTTTSAAKTTTNTKTVSSKNKTVSEKPKVKTTTVKSSTVKSNKSKSTHSKTTIEKNKTTKTVKSKKTTVKTKKTTVKQKGFSKSDIEQVSCFIKELVKSYGIGTECSDCSKQGVIYLSGNVDVWNGYSWNTPIETSKLKTTGRINEAVRSYINAIYNEWLKDGEMNKNDIKKYSCIYVYWNKTTKENYDLYLMW